MAKSERFDLRCYFKNTLERESYLEVVQSRVYKTALAHFLMGVSRIHGHRLGFELQKTNDFALSVLT